MPSLAEIVQDSVRWNLDGQQPDQCLDVKDFEVVAGGLTNQSWRFCLGGQQYLLRLEAHNSAALDINRSAEYQIQQLASDAGLAGGFIYRCPKKHYSIRRYLNGVSLHPQLLEHALIQKMASSLRQLHQLPVADDLLPINLQQKIDSYWKGLLLVPENQALAGLRQPLQKLLQLETARQSLCHMDCGLANWLWNAEQQKLWLLDWEYAAPGDPYWDLAAIWQEQRLSTQQWQHLLQCYGDIDSAGLELACQQMQYLAALWYRLQNLSSVEQCAEQLQQLQQDL